MENQKKESRDLSTVIMEQKAAPNKLMVEQETIDDNSTVMMSPAKLAELKIFKGELVFIRGKKRKETLCVVMTDANLENGKIRMNKVVRRNISVRLGDYTVVRKAGQVENLAKIHVLPMDDSVEGFTGDFSK